MGESLQLMPSALRCLAFFISPQQEPESRQECKGLHSVPVYRGFIIHYQKIDLTNDLYFYECRKYLSRVRHINRNKNCR